MRILVITNYYPPSNYGGGYMQLCEEVTDGLADRGHEIKVLTSRCPGQVELFKPYPVYRYLTIDPDWRSGKPAAWQFFVGRKKRERRALAIFHELVGEFEPDIIFIWHPMGLPREMLRAAQQYPGIATVFYLADYWLELPDEYSAYWHRTPARTSTRLLKSILARIALHMLAAEGKPTSLDVKHAICVSDYVRRRLTEQGLLPASAITIHNGIDIARFSPLYDLRAQPSTTLKCLVAGRLVPDKGVHTVIEALSLLKESDSIDLLTLTILGSGPRDYVEMLRRQVISVALDEIVTFLPSIPREQMPDMLRAHNVLIASAEYDEPLARMGQEAMGCGLIVVGTTTGGSAEILTHEVNGLTFQAGDAADLARQLKHLLDMPPEHRTRLAAAGRETVITSFDITLTISHVEEHLRSLTRLSRASGIDT